MRASHGAAATMAARAAAKGTVSGMLISHEQGDKAGSPAAGPSDQPAAGSPCREQARMHESGQERKGVAHRAPVGECPR
jgi:hypothetical protein